MSAFNTVSKKNPCPVCAGHNSGCKQKKRDADFILCRKFMPGDQVPFGWKYIGQAKRDNSWSQFAKVDPNAKSNVKPFIKQAPKPVDVLTLDEHIDSLTAIQQQLRMDDNEARQWLEDKTSKAFTDFAQSKKWVATYERGQLLEGVNPNHPSTNFGRTLKTNSGLLLAMPWIDGRVCGFQHVPKGRIEAGLKSEPWTRAKYKHLTECRLPAPFDDYPIGFYLPDTPTEPNTLILSEGVLKSQIISYLSNQNVVGSANTGSFKDAHIELAIQHFGRFIYSPDAGAVATYEVINQYYQTAQRFKKHGFDVLVYWWGQYDKAEHLDADDMLLQGRGSEFELITFDEFFFNHVSPEMREKVLNAHRGVIDINSKPKAKNAVMAMNLQKQKPLFNPSELPATRETLQNELYEAIFQDKTPCHILRYAPGFGKTTALAMLGKKLKWLNQHTKKRVAIITRDKKAQAAMADAFKEQQFYGFYSFEGRNDTPETKGYCGKKSYIDTYGEKNQNGYEYCKTCSLRDDCKVTGYLKQKKPMEAAGVVLMNYNALLNDGNLINRFDIVIADEDITTAMVKTETITGRDLQKTFENINERGCEITPVIDGVLDGLQRVFNFVERKAGKQFEAIPLFNWWIDNVGDIDLEAVISSDGLDTKRRLFDFEAPGNEKIPKRFLLDLIEVIADTKHRAHITPSGIVFRRIKRAAAELKNKKFVLLDGTPKTALWKEFFGSDNVKLYGPETSLLNCEITKVTGRLYSGSNLKRDPKDLRDLEAFEQYFINQWGSEKHLTVGPKSIMDAEGQDNTEYLFQTEPKAKGIWFGGSEARGTNDFEGYETIALIGHYQPPPLSITQTVNALRDSIPENDGVTEVIKRTWLADGTEVTAGRIQKEHTDKLIQETMDEAIAGEMVQTINRLRPVLKDKPVKVLLISDWASEKIPVDNIIDRADMLKIVEGGRDRQQRQHINKLAKQRETEAWQKIEAFERQNPGATYKEIEAATGCSPTTISKHINHIRQQLRTEHEQAIAAHNSQVEQVIESVVKTRQNTTIPGDKLRETASVNFPHITQTGELMIPMASPEKYRWWQGGQSQKNTLIELATVYGHTVSPKTWHRYTTDPYPEVLKRLYDTPAIDEDGFSLLPVDNQLIPLPRQNLAINDQLLNTS